MEKRIITIPATKHQFTQTELTSAAKRKTAAYARVSTDHEEQQSSYAAQVNYYTHFIQAHSEWEFAGIYSDEGISGCSTKKREGFNSMVEDALAGKIDLIITKSVSRFARNTVDSLTTIQLLKEHGIEVFFEEQNIWSFDGKCTLMLSIMSSIAQEEARSISENVTWGHRRRLADGKVSVPFGRFLGYDKGEKGSLVINENEAKIVRRIYALYLSGLSFYGISKVLTSEGIPSPGHKQKWYGRTIQSILTNEKYRGDALLQKTYSTDFLTKIRKVNTGEVPQYYVENSHEAIVDPEIFEMVQKEIECRKEQKGNQASMHIFSGKIRCGCCGGWFGSKVWHSNDKYRVRIWQCNQKYANDEKCTTPHKTTEQLQTAFLKAVNQLITEKDMIFAEFDRMKILLFDTTELEVKRTSFIDEAEQVSQKLTELIAENAAFALNQEEYNKKYDPLMEHHTTLLDKINDVTSKIQGQKSRQRRMEIFMDVLSAHQEVVTEFTPELWISLVSHATVLQNGNVTFTFKNGTEITIEH